MPHIDAVLVWVSSLIGSFALCVAKLGFLLYRRAPLPPSDVEALKLWERKRRWLIYSELSALPAFATIAVLVGRLRVWPVEAVVLFSMAMGALGFAFLLDGLQNAARRRLGMEESNG